MSEDAEKEYPCQVVPGQQRIWENAMGGRQFSLGEDSVHHGRMTDQEPFS
jgi:hypothetical protein